jgi:antitoxin protein of toxin-antitoxin system
MSILDKVKEVLGQNTDKAKQGTERAGDMADEKTGGKYGGQVDSAQQRADDYLDNNRDDGTGTGTRPTP